MAKMPRWLYQRTVQKVERHRTLRDRIAKMQLESVNEELSRQTALAQTTSILLAAYRRSSRTTRRGWPRRGQIVSCANERLLCDILIIYDDLQRALEAECEADELRNGISKIHTNLANFLKENGVREIPVDGKFDPSCHEALAMGEGEDGTILEVYQKGYYLGNKVLRTSKVKVARST